MGLVESFPRIETVHVSFDSIAPHYRWMEALLAGNKLQACRTAFIERVSFCLDVLLLGEGNGRFLVECRRRLPKARITVVDSSRAMLDRAVARLRASGLHLRNINVCCTDARGWHPAPGEFDLVVTNFFLDCFEKRELDPLMAQIATAAKSECFWLLSDFRVPQKGLPKLRAVAIHYLMYWFFRGVTGISAREIVLPDSRLQLHGFRLLARQRFDWGLIVSELWTRDRGIGLSEPSPGTPGK